VQWGNVQVQSRSGEIGAVLRKATALLRGEPGYAQKIGKRRCAARLDMPKELQCVAARQGWIIMLKKSQIIAARQEWMCSKKRKASLRGEHGYAQKIGKRRRAARRRRHWTCSKNCNALLRGKARVDNNAQKIANRRCAARMDVLKKSQSVAARQKVNGYAQKFAKRRCAALRESPTAQNSS